MAYVSNPIRNSAEWDSVEVGGAQWPDPDLPRTLCIVKGFKQDYGWDVKSGKGTKGATLTLTTFPPAEGSITLVLHDETHFAAAEEFLEQFDYDPAKKKTNPVDIFHPLLASRGINSVVCKSIDGPNKTGAGRWEIVIDLIEYLPVPKKDNTDTAKGSKGFSAEAHKKLGGTDDPIDAAYQERIKALTAEAKKP